MITSAIESTELTEGTLKETANISPTQGRELREGIAKLQDYDSDCYGSEQKVLVLNLECGFTLEQSIVEE
ncbi:hypothetical protein Htur_4533 (plasmid) [Haloterrigena turkmenica DSM 5511]|uniref:Uncharacterized protein n=1 Tax=Haloterrigena turkmenica (strain ATCC 51198 / DSM 5511 / JCM 9101 / NCIMB 13204 / VKM B-1734 / 4k) TaxID=543526 RepID=D2S1U0_HALTV|nr:hypothetical protein [Haloterrigena turkmenica]ADB63337.1 hypothetical protein Htur_4533 [Haloterrigena turkmenica DSM 5511]